MGVVTACCAEPQKALHWSAAFSDSQSMQQVLGNHRGFSLFDGNIEEAGA
jgi:hypothetical protein